MLARAIARATLRYRGITPDHIRHCCTLAGWRLGLSKHPDQCYSHRTYAQSAEDQIVLGLFNLLGIDRPSYIDVGAHHPWVISNTALLYRLGSRGVNVEPNPDLISAFHKHRPEDTNLNIGVADEEGRLQFYRFGRTSGRNTFSIKIATEFMRAMPRARIRDQLTLSVMPLDAVINKYCAGRYPDFLSIDTEGLDDAILAAADFSRSSPKVICVERATDQSVAARDVLRTRGYVAYVRTWANVIMVREDVWRALKL
jgi:FkbM family methyltransferase